MKAMTRAQLAMQTTAKLARQAAHAFEDFCIYTLYLFGCCFAWRLLCLLWQEEHANLQRSIDDVCKAFGIDPADV
jgi:hypothetical protein